MGLSSDETGPKKDPLHMCELVWLSSSSFKAAGVRPQIDV